MGESSIVGLRDRSAWAARLTTVQLGRIGAMADRTLRDLASQEPELFRLLAKDLAASRKAAVVTAVGDTIPELTAAIDKLALNGQPADGESFPDEIVGALRRAKVKKALLAQAEGFLRALEVAGQLDDPARDAEPLRTHPLTRQPVERARLWAVIDTAGLPAARRDALLPELGNLDGIRTGDLTALVDNGALTQAEADRIGLAVVAFRLAGSSAEATRAVLETRSGNQRRVQSVSDLAAFEASDWRKVIETAGLEPPDGLTPDAFARELANRTARILPTDFLLHRATAVPPGLTKLVQNNPPGPDELPDDPLVRLRRRNPGLGLREVLAGTETAAVKAREIERRIGLVAKVWSGNPDKNLLALDYSPESGDVDTIADLPQESADRAIVLENFKAHQRTFVIGGNTVTALRLLDAGFDAARKIMAVTPEDFQRATGLDAERSVAAYRNAQDLTTAAGVKAIALLQVGQAGAGAPVAVANSATMTEYLSKIPGYGSLFQDYGFCDCDSCGSVLGLSAYFVDLMYFVERAILDQPQNFRQRPTHPLHLRTRRPDLWTEVTLTCATANEVVPYLDVINGILEKYLATQTTPPAGDVWEPIAANNPRFALPFHWPLERIETYLGHFGKRWLDVAAVCRASEEIRAKAQLRLSDTEWQMIVTPTMANFTQLSAADQERLFKLYRVNVYQNGTTDHATTKLLMQATGLSRPQLGELLVTSSFVRGNTTIAIRAGRGTTESIQNDVEIVEGLNAANLDRLHRFYRLLRRLPWSTAELDLVLATATNQGLAAGLNDAALRTVAKLVNVQERFGLTVQELQGLWSELPNQSIGGAPGFFDALFNPPQFAGLGSPIPYQPNPAVFFLHPSFNTGPAAVVPDPQDNTLTRLLTGLRVNDQELAQLLTYLARPLGLDPAGATIADRRLRLSIGNLTLLYRHAVLARKLHLSIDALFQLLEVAGIRHGTAAAEYVASWSMTGGVLQDDLRTLLDAAQWTAASSLSGDEIAFVSGKSVRDAAKLPSPATLSMQIVQAIRADRAFEFADTVLSGLPNGAVFLTEDQSRQIMQRNAALFEAVPDAATLRLKATVLPEPTAAAVQLPQVAGIVVAAADVAARLAAFSIHRLLPRYLATAIGVPATKMAALLRASRQNVVLESAAFLQSVTALAHGTSTDRTRLVELVTALLPSAVLYQEELWDAETIDFVQTHTASFGQANGLSAESVRLAAQFEQLVSGPNPAYATTSLPPDAAAVRQAVDAGVSNVSSVVLARALRTQPAAIDALRPHLFGQLPTNVLDALGTLVQCLALGDLLSVTGETLKDLALIPATPPASADTEYRRLRRAAEGLLAAFRVKYQADAEFRLKVEPYEDKLRSRKRDGLVAYLRFKDPVRFEVESDLYHYFLLDVELEGCARTTRMAAAVFSLQLYVHRVLMQLERSDNFAVASGGILPDEWAWRQHYRVWEANRKIFLHPENYLEPGIRDNKTPLFQELEDTLLQQQIGEQNVRNACAAYLNGVDELSRLRIVAACSQSVKGIDGKTRDVVHLLGSTADDTPTFYYRAIEGLQSATEPSDVGFNAWRPITISIPVKTCGLVIHGGMLHVFWAEIVTQPKTAIVGGSSEFQGYRHKTTIKYSALMLDGRWTAPQRLRFLTPQGGENDSFVVEDTLRSLPRSFSVGQIAPMDLEFQIGPADKPITVQVPKGKPILFDVTVSLKAFPLYDTSGDPHFEPKDDYTLAGEYWHTPYPVVESKRSLIVNIGPLSFIVDLWTRLASEHDAAPYGIQSGLGVVSDAAGAVQGLGYGTCSYYPGNSYFTSAIALRLGITPSTQSLLLNPGTNAMDLVPINDNTESCIANIGGEQFYLRLNPDKTTLWTCRLGSSVARQFAEDLFTGNLDTLLRIGYQALLVEADAPFTLPSGGTAPSTLFDYRAAMGSYYREIFAHIPWLIANHLHSQGQFAAAQRWFHYLFNPAADNVPAANPAQKRVWQFREFRQEQVWSFRRALGDSRSLEVYQRDPANPHAIARLRPGAYQRAAIMQYINNLLDWGDSLFAQFTAESINEATMLYILASDILGPRAVDVGDCGEGQGPVKTYDSIAAVVRAGHQFVIEVENFEIRHLINPFKGTTLLAAVDGAAGIAFTQSAATAAGGPTPPAGAGAGAGGGISQPLGWQQSPPMLWSSKAGTPMGDFRVGMTIDPDGGRTPDVTGGWRPIVTPDPVSPPEIGPDDLNAKLLPFGRLQHDLDRQPGLTLDPDNLGRPFDRRPKPNVKPWELLDTSVVFCIPDNKELRACWDRVEDRLYKIRNCMDMSGVRRLPDLFGPEIDPRLLAKMRAAGLTLEDVLNVTSGNVPPYRFTYLLDKARQYAGTVQSFGSALLSALEKRDAEALTRLRTVHEQHLLKLRTRLQEFDLATAQQTLAGLQAQKAIQEYRLVYYKNLSQTGLTAWERTQQVSQHSANALILTAGILSGGAGILSLIPQLGAPTAMKYGGVELGSSVKAWADMARDTAQMAQLVASSAGIEAGYQRRDDEWNHQAALAQGEIDQLSRQVSAAEIRIKIAERSLAIHEQTIEQIEEIFQFYQDRFTNADLYTWLSKHLRHLYRDAFNSAFSMALLAEQAYRFERPEDATTLLSRDYWDASAGGLLAGERLQLDLQALDRKYLETNYRRLEVEQSFSLAQFDPGALVALREQGECTFDVPELFYDLAYPGHYRRRIQAVRLSMPCVAGPFANVSATLRLTGSQIRLNPDSALIPVSGRHSVAMAASGGHNDAGVFEFTFRDDRYMPFEGSGAVSAWKLSLPKAFRPFDYDTISDVILRVSYSAVHDDGLRDRVEGLTSTLDHAIIKQARERDLTCLLSLRRDFPDAFARLMRTQAGTDVPFDVDARRLPWFIGTRPLTISSARMLLRTKHRPAAPTAMWQFNGTPVSQLTGDPRGAGLNNTGQMGHTVFASPALGASAGTWFKRGHTICLTNAGDIAPAAGSDGALNPDEVLDVLFEVRYRVAP